MSPEENTFICPECGSREASTVLMVETEPDAPEPWGSILQRIICGQCRSVIPAHLGERWDGISVEAARAEWVATYKQDNRLHGGGGDGEDEGDDEADCEPEGGHPNERNGPPATSPTADQGDELD